MLKNKLSLCAFLQIITLCFISLSVDAQTLKYTYDALGRVVNVDDSTNGDRSYDYDPAGNRTKVSIALPRPIISPNGGTYSSAQLVSLKNTVPEALIYYTTDGSTPTKSSKLYSSPFLVNISSMVKAFAVKADMKDSSVSSAQFTITVVAAPTITPNGGTMSATTQQVVLASVTPGALIYYTTNNSTPTTASTLYTAPFTISSSLTIKAFAVKAGMISSVVSSASFTLPTGIASTPTISPNGGTFSGSQLVTLSSTTLGADIYYTLDNQPPTTISTRYSGAPFTLTGSATVRAMAVKLGMANSPVVSALFTISSQEVVSVPTIIPNGGVWASPQSVTLTSATSNAQIYYTTNNTLPIPGSPGTTEYTAALSLTSNATIRVIAVKQGMTNSPESSAIFTVVPQPVAPTGLNSYLANDCAWTATWNAVAGVDNYYFMDTLGNGSYLTGTTVNVVCPVGNSESKKPKSVQACKSGVCSNKALFSGTPPPASAPTISPASTSFSSSVTVTLYPTTADSIIYYTTNGSTPTTLSTVYSAPFSVSSTVTVRAMAAKQGMLNSAETSASYTYVYVDTQSPSTPGKPSFSNITTSSANVSWSASTDNVNVTGYEYSVSGSSWSSAGLSASLSGLSTGTTYIVSVRARDAAGNYSSTSSESFTTAVATVASPSFSPGSTSYSGTLSVSLSTTTANSTIYYTIDGSTPTTSSVSGTSVSISNKTVTVRAIAAKQDMVTSGESSATYTYVDKQNPTTPGTPSFNSVASSSANATWSASTDNVGISSYEYSLYAGSTFIRSVNVGLSQTAGLTGLSPSTGYTVYVKAKDAEGNYSDSSSASFTTSAAALPSPSNLLKYQSNACVWHAEWQSVPGATEYLFADTQGIETKLSGTSFEFYACSFGQTVDTKKPNWVRSCNGTCSAKAYF